MGFKLTQSKKDYLDDLLYKTRKPKVALKEIERWMSKTPNDDMLLYLKADILLHCDRLDESVAILESLLARDPPTTAVPPRDIHTLLFRIQQAKRVYQSSAGQSMTELWRNFLKPHKDRKRFLLDWYDVAAVAALRKELPSDNDMYFQYIAVAQMAAQTLLGVDATRAKMHDTLALRFLQAAVEQTISKKASRMKIVKPQDMALVLDLYSSQNKQVELLSILNSDELGIASSLSFDRGAMIREKLRILEEQQQWSDLGAFCKHLIQSGDSILDMDFDWRVFESFCLALQKVDNSSASELKLFLQEFLEKKTTNKKERNHLLAYVALPYLQLSSTFWDTTPDILELRLRSCVSYFQSFGSHPCFLQDLRPFIKNMVLEERLKLMQYLQTVVDAEERGSSEKTDIRCLGLQTNILKMEYLVQLSIGHRDEALKDFLATFSCKCLSVLQSFGSLKQSAYRELMLLLVTARIKLYLLAVRLCEADQAGIALESLALLEHHIRLLPADKEALLMHICLSRHLGLDSKALATFPHLQIKGLLVEGVSHVLYTRLATLHPFPVESTAPSVKEAKVEDPMSGMEIILDTYDNIIDEVTTSIAELKEQPIYHTLAHSSMLRKKYERSLFRRLVCLELRRTQRFRGTKVDDRALDNIGVLLEDLSDEREYNIIPAYELGNEMNTQQMLLIGPEPRSYWLATMILWDDTQGRITQTSTFHAQDLQTAESMVAGASEIDRSQLTASELEILPAWQLLRRLLLHLGDSRQKNESTTSQLIEGLKLVVNKLRPSQNPPSFESQPFPHWHTVHELMLRIEFFRACRKLGEANTSTAKSRKQSTSPTYISFKALIDSVREAQTHIFQMAEAWEEMLSENAVAEKLLEKSKEEVFGQKLNLFLGVDCTKTAATLIIAAKSSLQGIVAAAKL